MVKTFINYLIRGTITLTKEDSVGYDELCGEFFTCRCGELVAEQDNFCSNCGENLKFKEID